MPDNQAPNHPDTQPSTSEHIEERAEHLKHATGSAAGSAHEAVDRMAERMHRGTDKAAGAAERAADRSREALDSARAHANDWMDNVRDYVREQPGRSLVMAVAAGWLIGRLMRHR